MARVWRQGAAGLLLLSGILVCGCATLTPEGARVPVYHARLDDPPPQRTMPAGCDLVEAKPPVRMTELDLEGQKDPFRKTRNEAAAGGANTLLVLRRTIMGRRNADCPGSMRITECSGALGAWYEVTVASYSCTPQALAAITLPLTAESDKG